MDNETRNDDKLPMSASETPRQSPVLAHTATEKAKNVSNLPPEKQIIEYFESLGRLTGTDMMRILSRVGVAITRLSLDMGYAENYLSQNLKVRYRNTTIPWRLTGALRNKVGHLAFDTAYHELYAGYVDHILNVSGAQLRQMVRERGSNFSQLAKGINRSRQALQAIMIRHHFTPLPLWLTIAVRNVFGEIDYELMFKRTSRVKTHVADERNQL